MSDQLDLAKEVKKLTKKGSSYAYFFNKVTSPNWLMPLLNEGFFTNPPAAEKDGQWVSFPVWPEINYLLKVARVSPDEVTVALEKVPDTDNQYVLDMFVKILLELGAKRAVRFTDRVVKFLDTPFQFRVHEESAELVRLLAKGGYVSEALKITDALLVVMPDPRADKVGDDKYQRYLIEPQIKYRDYDYQEIIEKVVPDLTAADPKATIKLFSKLLNDAVTYKLVRYEHDTLSEGQDYSNTWRSAIAQSKRSNGDQPFDGLVSALRDSLQGLLKSSLPDKEKVTALKEVVNLKFLIFSRIVEYVLQDLKDQAPYKGLYDEIHKNFGNLIKERTLIVESGEVRPQPGITMEELSKLNNSALLNKLTSHEPSDRLFGRDAIDNLITALIKSDPSRFVKIAPKFLVANNQLANGFIFSLDELVVNLDLKTVNELLLVLSDWVKNAKPGKYPQYLLWANTALARLVDKISGQKGKDQEYASVASARPLLDIILKLARDPDPTEKQENKRTDVSWDPVSLAINSTRGEALHALANFIGWAHRNKADKAYTEEAYAELDWHLEIKNDPSPAIRSVYGQHLPLLDYINNGWVKNNLNKIFSDDDYGDAAWDSFVSFTQIYKDLLPVIEPILRKRLATLKTYSEDSNRLGDKAQTAFVHHLMAYYWNGFLDLSDRGIIKTFFETADVKYRIEALHFIGFAVKEDKGSTEKEVQQRLMALWDYRFVTISKIKDSGQKKELEEFGIWFASNGFEEGWAIDRLQEVLTVTQNANPDFMVLEKLSTVARHEPIKAVNCLSQMIDGARERWSIGSWEEQASAIIESAIKSGDKAAIELAEAQVNKLVDKGHYNFRNLLVKNK